MLLGVLVAVGAICLLLYQADQNSKKHRAEMEAVRTYENERDFRLQLSEARDEANRENSPESFEEAYSHLGYLLEELHRMADQGSIEAAGNWPSFDFVQAPDAIEQTKANRPRRAAGLRRNAQRIAELEARLAAIEEYEARRKMRCLMSMDRDDADVANNPELFEDRWSETGYPLATLHRLCRPRLYRAPRGMAAIRLCVGRFATVTRSREHGEARQAIAQRADEPHSDERRRPLL